MTELLLSGGMGGGGVRLQSGPMTGHQPGLVDETLNFGNQRT